MRRSHPKYAVFASILFLLALNFNAALADDLASAKYEGSEAQARFRKEIREMSTVGLRAAVAYLYVEAGINCAGGAVYVSVNAVLDSIPLVSALGAVMGKINRDYTIGADRIALMPAGGSATYYLSSGTKWHDKDTAAAYSSTNASFETLLKSETSQCRRNFFDIEEAGIELARRENRNENYPNIASGPASNRDSKLYNDGSDAENSQAAGGTESAPAR